MPSLSIDLPLVQGDGLNVPYYKAAHYPTMPWPGVGKRSFVYAHAQYGPPIMFGPLLGHDVTGVDVYVDRGGDPRSTTSSGSTTRPGRSATQDGYSRPTARSSFS